MKLYALILSLPFFYTILFCAGLQYKFWQTPVLSIPPHTPISSWRTRFSSAVAFLHCSVYLVAFIFQSIPSFLILSLSGWHTYYLCPRQQSENIQLFGLLFRTKKAQYYSLHKVEKSDLWNRGWGCFVTVITGSFSSCLGWRSPGGLLLHLQPLHLQLHLLLQPGHLLHHLRPPRLDLHLDHVWLQHLDHDLELLGGCSPNQS